MQILSFTTAFPSPANPLLGTFIATRLRRLATANDICALVPVPYFRWNARSRLELVREPIPAESRCGSLVVRYLRWLYIPGGGCLTPLFLFLQTVLAARRLHRARRFQLIDAHFGYPDGVAAVMLGLVLRLPVTITIRGCEVDHALSAGRRIMMRWAFRRASRVIALSERLRKFAIQLGIDPLKITTVPNGVDREIFHCRDRSECRRKRRLETAGTVILAAGNLVELKGFHLIIRALKAIGGRPGESVTLVIAGRDAGFGGELRRLTAELGMGKQVRFEGAVAPAALAELMCAADMFCLASFREGWPNVVHEALSCGTPVVASDVGSVPELLPGSDYGITVPPRDVSGLERGLREALSREWDREKIARWGQSRSWEAVAAELDGVFREITVTRPAAGVYERKPQAL